MSEVKVYYIDMVDGKKHWTKGAVSVEQGSFLGKQIKVVRVSRKASETLIPEHALASESRHLLRQA